MPPPEVLHRSRFVPVTRILFLSFLYISREHVQFFILHHTFVIFPTTCPPLLRRPPRPRYHLRIRIGTPVPRAVRPWLPTPILSHRLLLLVCLSLLKMVPKSHHQRRSKCLPRHRMERMPPKSPSKRSPRRPQRCSLRALDPDLANWICPAACLPLAGYLLDHPEVP